jgi:mannose-6-phosphate isomerase-like protein (cupin superfamily)
MHDDDDVIVLGPGEGRAYSIGPMRGVFKADHDACCVSEWSVEPGRGGPGPHSHPEQVELFLVTEGTMAFLVGERWLDAPTGTFLRVPAGVTHDFENRTTAPARAFNVFMPGGGFEAAFASWAGTSTTPDVSPGSS